MSRIGAACRCDSSNPAPDSPAINSSDGYVTTITPDSGSIPAILSPCVYAPHTKLASSSTPIPTSACGDCVPNPITINTTPTTINASRLIRAMGTGSRHNTHPTSANEIGVVPAINALTCAADVNLPPIDAIRKKGKPAPSEIMAQHFNGNFLKVRTRDATNGASTIAGTRKRISATSAGVSVDAPIARMDSEKLAQMISVSPMVSQPAAGLCEKAGRPRVSTVGDSDFMNVPARSAAPAIAAEAAPDRASAACWKFSPSPRGESIQKRQALKAPLAEAANVQHMDSKDYQIIAALQANGRMTNQELSEQVNLTPTPCLRRLRMLEESGMIRGYTAVVDEEAFGLPVTAFVGIKLKEHTAESVRKFERAIQTIDAVLDCYVMTGQVDYLLRVLTQSLQDYERFVRKELHAIPGIQSIDTSFAYSRVKRSVVFPGVDGPG